MAKKLKAEIYTNGQNRPVLAGKTLAMIFEKPSLRTKLSFEVAMTQMGGHAVYLGPQEIGLGVRESIADVSRVVSSMGDILMARVFSHAVVCELARYARVPVINGLSDWEHPCQILSDIFTILEYKKHLEGLHIAYIGDGENNVAHSLALASALFGIKFIAACPRGYFLNQSVIGHARFLAKKSGGAVAQTCDPVKAVKGADVVYTDTWISMGDEAEKEKRLKIFHPYQVSANLMKYAKHDALFMHDLPAYRGNEVSADVIDGKQSVVFHQAENRLHAQKALLCFLLGVT